MAGPLPERSDVGTQHRYARQAWDKTFARMDRARMAEGEELIHVAAWPLNGD